MNNTPLRYPGGKSIMTSFFEALFERNNLRDVVYCEPYAGGAGAAVNLLLNNSVAAIRINDASIGIYSFWNALIADGDRFLEQVEQTPVTLSEWQKQRRVFKQATVPSFELGFATFFLSRTNRSGILAAGPIGGQEEKCQRKAKYKLDCRFNRKDLMNRLRNIIGFRERIFVSNLDALEFLKQLKGENLFVYLDPPYYRQGKALYLNYYQHEDHVMLSKFLRRTANFRWVLSYDNVPEILALYADFPLHQFTLSYTAQDVKNGSELLTHSAGLSFESLETIKKGQKRGTVSLFTLTE
jgi:DNA adenine methylase